MLPLEWRKNKVADIEGDNVFAFYACTQKSAFEFIKTIAEQVALRFPDAFREAGIDRIRELAGQDSEWDIRHGGRQA